MSFYDVIKEYDWEKIKREVYGRTAADVETALSARRPTLEQFVSFLSPAAEPYLEEMAQGAHRLTQQRFGKVINLFAPLYLSNVCVNGCVYCGFNSHNPVERLTLDPDQAAVEGEAIRKMGFQHLLLVSGEAPKIVSMDYLEKVAARLRPLFSSISIEIFPLDTPSYANLIQQGVDGLVVFQETYNEKSYPGYHPRGKKKDFRWRLETPDRGGEAGFRRLGLGALLGLEDWRVEAFYLALHASHLLRTYWKSQVSISFPRLRPAAGAFKPLLPVEDFHLVQLMTALRLFLPDVGFVLSTRESPEFRDHMIPLGITTMSAGSKTDPGGYAHEKHAEGQFEVADERPPAVVAQVIASKGYEPVWKDWDPVFLEAASAGNGNGRG